MGSGGCNNLHSTHPIGDRLQHFFFSLVQKTKSIGQDSCFIYLRKLDCLINQAFRAFLLRQLSVPAACIIPTLNQPTHNDSTEKRSDFVFYEQEERSSMHVISNGNQHPCELGVRGPAYSWSNIIRAFQIPILGPRY
jgi:hypothetical protein